MSEKQSSKERIKEITAGIEKGIMELFESDRYRNYLTTMGSLALPVKNGRISTIPFLPGMFTSVFWMRPVMPTQSCS